MSNNRITKVTAAKAAGDEAVLEGGFTLDLFVKDPSIEAISYQAQVLIHEIRSISDSEYPTQACQIAGLLLPFSLYLEKQLLKLSGSVDPGSGHSTIQTQRTIILGGAIHKLYSFLRYVKTSSPQLTPPGIQVALTELVDLYFPKLTLGNPVCLVRPQWKYNLQFVPLSWFLRDLIAPQDLDEHFDLNKVKPDNLLETLWNWWYSGLKDKVKAKTKSKPLRHMAILSFAGLDTHDTLLYPLLAHELGHFIDFSHDPPVYKSVECLSRINPDDVRKALLTKDPVRKREPTASEVNRATELLQSKVEISVRELLADILATRMLGFGYFVALAEFLKTVAVWPQKMITEGMGYPGIRFRLKTIFDHMTDGDFPVSIMQFLREVKGEEAEKLDQYLTCWDKRLKSKESSGSSDSVEKLAEKAIIRALGEIVTKAREIIPADKCATLTEKFFERIKRLKSYLPPCCDPEPDGCFSEIVSAAWAYQILYGEDREKKRKELADRFDEYARTCNLTLKAIELMHIAKRISDGAKTCNEDKTPDKADSSSHKHVHGTLSHQRLEFITQKLTVDDPSHLDVVPLARDAIDAASIDIRLGHWFAIARRTKMPQVDISKSISREILMRAGLQEVFVPSEGLFYIHPGDFVLGVTLEFIALPNDLMAYVEGKSSLGRTGLLVVTASKVDPGFHGVVVLELVNMGTVPLLVRPGMPIAQLVLHALDEPVSSNLLYRGRYFCQIKPLP